MSMCCLGDFVASPGVAHGHPPWGAREVGTPPFLPSFFFLPGKDSLAWCRAEGIFRQYILSFDAQLISYRIILKHFVETALVSLFF